MTATTRLAELEERLVAMRGELEGLSDQRAEAERQLARAVADGAPEAQRRELSDAVEQLDREGGGYAGAIELLEGDRPPLQVAAAEEQLAAAEAEADRLEEEARTLHVEAHRELERHATEFAVVAERLRQARRAATEGRRAALVAAGAEPWQTYRPEPKNKLPVGPWAAEFARVSRALESYTPDPEV